MKKGFSIQISKQNIDIKSFISCEYDNFHLQTEHFDFLLEGVLLNKKKLLHEYALKDFDTLIRELFAQKKQDLIKEFEGEIRGFALTFAPPLSRFAISFGSLRFLRTER